MIRRAISAGVPTVTTTKVVIHHPARPPTRVLHSMSHIEIYGIQVSLSDFAICSSCTENKCDIQCIPFPMRVFWTHPITVLSPSSHYIFSSKSDTASNNIKPRFLPNQHTAPPLNGCIYIPFLTCSPSLMHCSISRSEVRFLFFINAPCSRGRK